MKPTCFFKFGWGGADALNFKPHQKRDHVSQNLSHGKERCWGFISHVHANCGDDNHYWDELLLISEILIPTLVRIPYQWAVPAQSLRNVSTHGVWCTNMAGQTQNSDNLCPGASKQTRNKPITPQKILTWNQKNGSLEKEASSWKPIIFSFSASSP